MNTHKLSFYAKSVFISEYAKDKGHNILLLSATEDEAIKLFKQISFLTGHLTGLKIFYFPSSDCLPYDRLSPDPQITSARANILSQLAITSSKTQKLIITNAVNLLIKEPSPKILAENSLRLYVNLKITTEQLANFLVKSGFHRTSTAVNCGEFALKGEIIDVVLTDTEAYRINFNWQQIESIKSYDTYSQISQLPSNELILHPTAEVMLTPETINNFTTNYVHNFGRNFTNAPVYRAILEGKKFAAYEQLLPLFYQQLSLLSDYLEAPVMIYDNLCLQSILEWENSCKDFYQARLQSNEAISTSLYPALPPEQLYISSTNFKEILAHSPHILLENDEEGITYPRLPLTLSLAVPFNTSLSAGRLEVKALPENKSALSQMFEFIESNNHKIPLVFCHSKSTAERFKNIVQNYSYRYFEANNISDAKIGVVNLIHVPLDYGFCTDQYIFIAAQEILGQPLSPIKKNSRQRLKNILAELDALTEGALVTHQEHGIGQFLGVETIEAVGVKHDCLKILYAGNDKLYVPVENMEVIKKYGDHEAELDKLGSSSWQRRKAKVKNRIKEIAEKLLTVAAHRKMVSIEPILFDEEGYSKFCSNFPHVETEDQIKALTDIKEDFAAGNLMDRLICGDVGFGKTEVAMRAAYMVAACKNHEHAQVAIIVPTTILCKQHYSRFLERFACSRMNIVQLSRFVTPAEAKKAKELISNGGAKIIIGTHALLSKEIAFKNLKLLIIDEEQHFGVNQKELLKELKSNVHILSLSATPIPRTLQMSLVGLKSLNLIATPPIDRLAVRTIITPFDPAVIRDALLREYFRGGKSFYVVPRIKDIPDIEKTLKENVPELKYKIAHGQMHAVLIDKVMNEFYEGEIDVLVSTTIIESGIDVAPANTIIIHKADQLGLSQLYQLRGRVGRSKVRGYAYLTLQANKPAAKDAKKRLEIMQIASSLGAGFTIASHDMDLRGFGNLVGQEQSGQIKEVGVELYQEMLDEQIALLQNQSTNHEEKMRVPSINLGLSIFIPEGYISDTTLRIGIYRRISNLLDATDVENFQDEIADRFGTLPAEFSNLLEIVKIKHTCQQLNIESLDAGTNGFVVKFYNNANPNLILNFVSKNPTAAKLKPDNKLIFIKQLDQLNIINEAKQFFSYLSTEKPSD